MTHPNADSIFRAVPATTGRGEASVTARAARNLTDAGLHPEHARALADAGYRVLGWVVVE